MAKRRLTKQQRQRIKDNQTHQTLTTAFSGEQHEGLVIAHYGADIDIEDPEGVVHRCHLRQNIAPMVVGDRVVWHKVPDNRGVVTAVLPRRSSLMRYDPQGLQKLVAANVDQIIVTCAVEPLFSTFLLDCYLAAAALTGIDAVIVLNKIDLLDDAALEDVKQQLHPYEQLGYQVTLLSSQDTTNINALSSALDQHASVFVGQSGVGKSSLIQHFVTSSRLAVNEISTQQKLGRHTTTTSRLYHLADGGDIIDSPGVREFGLGRIEPQQLFDAFIEFKPLQGECKFRNCLHQTEPHCALKAALEAGDVDASRMASFRKLLGS
jgi:ribosome biogenesis GTPase / thiamine phosphate phosphatase